MKSNYTMTQIKQFISASFLFIGILSLSQMTYASDCNIHIKDLEKMKVESHFEDRGISQQNRDLDEAKSSIAKALKKKGYTVVDDESEARFVVTEYYKSCTAIDFENSCGMGHGFVQITDMESGEDYSFYDRSMGIDIFDSVLFASKDYALKRALSKIPRCE